MRFKDPFYPNRPVQDPNYFEGRAVQIEEIIDAFYQTFSGNPRHFIITGDRGIGKSSLLVQAKKIASGDTTLAERLNIDLGVDKFNFVTTWVDAVEKQSVSNLVQIILTNLQSDISNFFRGLKIEVDLGGFLKIAAKESDEMSLSDIVNNFSRQLQAFSNRISKESHHGIVLMIDELDKIQVNSGIASFFKLVTEKLARDGVNNIVFACSGITGAVQKLEEEHASILRTFRDIPLPRFTEPESRDILESGFRMVGFTWDEAIISKVYSLAGGFPEPIHILGSELLSVSTDTHIDISDFNTARSKVIREIRKNKLGDLLKKAGYGKYQLILEAMAMESSSNVSLDIISKHIGQEANQFSTNIGTLLEKEIIIKVERGIYAFADPLLKEYIKEFGVIKSEKSVDEDVP